MIIFTLYFIIICVLIYKTSFFGIFKDDILNPKFFLFTFLIKITALAAFYLVYTKLYGSIQYSDTGNFYRDSKAIHDIAFSNFGEFLKLMFGFNDGVKGSYVFEQFLAQTTTWDKAPGEILYNDNRLILKFHALIHFFSFGNYFVHALFSCLLSFIGINWIYKTFKDLFKGREIYFFLTWILFPGVWFWTAGLFKEGPALFLIGLVLILVKRIVFDKKYSLKNLSLFLIAMVFSILYKPYLMLPLLINTFLFFAIHNKVKKHISLKYIISLILIFVLANFSIQMIFKKDVIKILSDRQRDFMDMSEGGLFLLGEGKFIRTPYNFSSLKIDSSQSTVKAIIKAGVTYSYCELSHQQDTLVCNSNRDTLSIYELLYIVHKANSTLKPPTFNDTWPSFLKAIPGALYITLCKPFFVDARNAMDLIASFENLIIILLLLFFIYNGIKGGFKNPWYVYFISMVLVVLILIGITSPNLGAIQRYRALVMPFILLIALLSSTITDRQKLSNFFKNKV